MRNQYESKIRTLSEHAWDGEVRWPEIEAWINNFSGDFLPVDEEQLYGLFVLSRFMYFGKRLVREMLKSLYRDHFESPLLQRIRRNLGGTKDAKMIREIYKHELRATRFIGVGNPAESGAHLLYYFRQVNYLPKDLFVDLTGAFIPQYDRLSGQMQYIPRDSTVSRYVFFDDLVGSGDQVSKYLTKHLEMMRNANKNIDLRFFSLFATTQGLSRLNDQKLFNGMASCMFELDDTYKAFDQNSRYFFKHPAWFDKQKLLSMTHGYGQRLSPRLPLGYRNGQLFLSFSHNTPDNVPPIFWNSGYAMPWSPVFIRYDKEYGVAP